jgi:hypothetical protein
MKFINYRNILFVLLIVIFVLIIITIILYNCKRETFDLGKSIDNVVDNAIHSVGGAMDNVDNNDALIDIEYNNAPIYINTDGDLQAYDKQSSHHGVRITSGDAVSKQDHIPPSRRGKGHSGGRGHGGGGHGSNGHGSGRHGSGGHGSGRHGGGTHGGGTHGGGTHGGGGGEHSGGGGRRGRGRRHGGGGRGRGRGGGGNPQCIDCTDPTQNMNYKNVEDECVCNGEKQCNKQCENCKWCITDGAGTCIPKSNKCANKPSPKKKICTLGNESTKGVPGGYGTQGCNLYKNYQKCLTCPSQGKCGVLMTDSNGDTSVSCGLSDTDDGCMGQPYAHDKTNKVWNCLNSPDEGSPPGFGCPNNQAPTDPDKTNNKLCSTSP